jgi:broad specificity phosphatase PhoE
MAMTSLLLVRHGATAWTSERRLQGRTDIDLSEQGRADVAALRPLVDAYAPAAVVVSPLRRARSTAALLSDLPARVDARWAEAGLGRWEGCLPDEVGPDYAEWRAGRLDPPGGEPLLALRDRVEAAVRDCAEAPGAVLVVTHGGTIRAVLDRFAGLRAEVIVPPAAPSLTVLELRDGGSRLRQFNAGAATG